MKNHHRSLSHVIKNLPYHFLSLSLSSLFVPCPKHELNYLPFPLSKGLIRTDWELVNEVKIMSHPRKPAHTAKNSSRSLEVEPENVNLIATPIFSLLRPQNTYSSPASEYMILPQKSHKSHENVSYQRQFFSLLSKPLDFAPWNGTWRKKHIKSWPLYWMLIISETEESLYSWDFFALYLRSALVSS